MFERYTEKARRVIFFARYEASELGSEAIEAEHILLGLVREDKQLAERSFRDPSSTIDAMRKQIRARFPAREKISASVDLPLSRSAKHVLTYAVEESERLGHRHIGTEHLILGILRDEKSLAAELLHERGLALETQRDGLKRESEAHPIDREQHLMAGPRLSDRLLSLIRILIRRRVIDEQDFDQQLGMSHIDLRFNSLVELLVSKGVISEDEKGEILGAGR